MITVDPLCPLQFFFIMIGGYIAIVVDVSEVVTFFFLSLFPYSYCCWYCYKGYGEM